MAQSDDAYKEAEKRIAQWQDGEVLDLKIQGLLKLPESLSALSNLQELVINRLEHLADIEIRPCSRSLSSSVGSSMTC